MKKQQQKERKGTAGRVAEIGRKELQSLSTLGRVEAAEGFKDCKEG